MTQVFHKLMQVPSWVAAWEADSELHKQVQTLHEDAALGRCFGVPKTQPVRLLGFSYGVA